MWTSEADAELARLKATGLSFRQVAEQMGVSRSAAISRFQRISGKKYAPSKSQRMHKYLKAELCKQRQRELEKLRKEFASLAGKSRNDYILVAYAAGMTQAAIGHAAGLTRERIRQIVSAGSTQQAEHHTTQETTAAA